jgi:hypothetical protein
VRERGGRIGGGGIIVEPSASARTVFESAEGEGEGRWKEKEKREEKEGSSHWRTVTAELWLNCVKEWSCRMER